MRFAPFFFVPIWDFHPRPVRVESPRMKVGIAQINGVIGDFPGNAKRLLQAYRECLEQGAELVVTPELSLAGEVRIDQEQRDPHCAFVEAAAMPELPMIVERFAMIADHHDQRAVCEPFVPEEIEQPSNLIVGFTQRGEVASLVSCPSRIGGELSGL